MFLFSKRSLRRSLDIQFKYIPNSDIHSFYPPSNCFPYHQKTTGVIYQKAPVKEPRSKRKFPRVMSEIRFLRKCKKVNFI